MAQKSVLPLVGLAYFTNAFDINLKGLKYPYFAPFPDPRNVAHMIRKWRRLYTTTYVHMYVHLAGPCAGAVVKSLQGADI